MPYQIHNSRTMSNPRIRIVKWSFIKKSLALLCILSTTSIYAQKTSKANAIGFRYESTLLGELSYQRQLKTGKRLELGFSFGGNKIHGRTFLVGTYQWTKNISGALSGYAGPSSAITYRFDERSSNSFHIGLGGQLGLEYDLKQYKAPIRVSIDTRPIWSSGPEGLSIPLALGVRYVW